MYIDIYEEENNYIDRQKQLTVPYVREEFKYKLTFTRKGELKDEDKDLTIERLIKILEMIPRVKRICTF